MPYKCEKIIIAGTQYDQRRKLTTEQVNAISILSQQGYSQRQLARMFGCSKGSIQNILHPQKRYPQKQRDTAYWTEAKRRYRARKQMLYKSGVLTKRKRSRKQENYDDNSRI